MKFKVGDKVRCVTSNYNYITEGRIYEISETSNGWYYVIADHGRRDGYPSSSFVLADAVLTPEEVFEHLRKGTKLQHLHGTYGWKDITTPNELYYEDICNDSFRIKPEPEIIELNGKKYREIVD